MELEKFESESSLGHFIQKFDNFMKNIRIKLKNNKYIHEIYEMYQGVCKIGK